MYIESDLVHNRAGDLSPAQKVQLEQGWRRIKQIGGGLAGFMLILGVIFRLSGDQAGLIGTWVFAFAVIAALFSLDRTVKRVQHTGEVASITGSVQREKVHDEGTSYDHYVLLADQRLKLHEEDYDKFTDGATYIVYFLPRTGYVVSAEVVGE